MTEEQRYLFDTFGYLVLPDVLTDTQVEELRTTLRQPTEQFEPVAQAEGPLHWGKVWRDLLDLPTLTPVLEEVIGNHAVRERRARAKLPDSPTFRLDHVNVHTHVSEGFPGSSLHGGWKGTGGAQFSSYHDGRFYNGLVSVSFELYDTYPNNGGFGCIPGSHKSNLRLPESSNRVIVAAIQPLPDLLRLQRQAARSSERLRPYGIDLRRYPKHLLNKIDWDTNARLLTDQYSPANLLQAN